MKTAYSLNSLNENNLTLFYFA